MSLLPDEIKNIERMGKIVEDGIAIKDGVPMPSVIQISLVDWCNRACVVCPRSQPDIAPNNPVEMNWELVVMIYNDLCSIDYKGLVIFSDFGEPLLHPQIDNIVKLFSKKFRVDVVTNGDYLELELAKKFVSYGINKIMVSVYEQDYEKKIQDIIDVVGDKVAIRRRYLGWGDTLTNRAGTMGDGNKDTPCFYMSYFMMIDWNGDVLTCPHDWNRKMKFGNVAFQHLFDVWKSAPMVRFRTDLLKGRSFYPCIKCDANGMLHGKEHAKLWKEYLMQATKEEK